MNDLDTLLDRLSTTGLPVLSFPADSPDEALDLRDQPEFESQWLRVNDLVSDEPDSAALKKLRELSFKQTYAQTKNPELAGYVSDDFDLIGKALIAGVNDPWLNALWVAYSQGNFPCQVLSPVPGALRDLL